MRELRPLQSPGTRATVLTGKHKLTHTYTVTQTSIRTESPLPSPAGVVTQQAAGGTYQQPPRAKPCGRMSQRREDSPRYAVTSSVSFHRGPAEALRNCLCVLPVQVHSVLSLQNFTSLSAVRCEAKNSAGRRARELRVLSDGTPDRPQQQ